MISDLSTEDDLKLKQLCFNRTHFQRADFDSVRFVNFSRKRATLEQLHADLRIYLRHLQNSMIELINDDYADFVNLSSGLAALRDSVDKVKDNIQANWDNFESTVSDLEKCAQLVTHYLTQLNKIRREQIITSSKLSLLQSIQRLYTFLGKKPKQFGHIWFSKLFLLISSTEYWLGYLHPSDNEIFILQLKVPKEKCYQHATDLIIDQLCDELKFITNQDKTKISTKSNLATLLASLKLLQEKDHAELRVIAFILQTLRIDSHKISKMDVLLENVLNKVINLRQCWIIYAQNCYSFFEELEIFFDSCLLKSVISILDEKFSTILVPTDARLFHSCFKLITEKFISCWPTKNESYQMGLLRSIRDKFNLIIYFKLASQPLILSSKEKIKPEEFKFKIPDGGDACLCSYSNSILSSLNIIFSSDYFLPALANKFWEFVLQRMQDYLGWTQSILDYFILSSSKKQLENQEASTQSPLVSSLQKSNSPIPFKESSSTITTAISNNSLPLHTWLGLIVLYQDMQLFDTYLFQFCLSTIWDYIRQLKLDPTPFGQCLSLFSGKLSEKRKEIEQKLSEILGEDVAKNLSAVSDIPRQYRWTKRPLPIGFSTYLASAFEIFDQFAEETKKLGFSEVEMSQLRSKAMVIASTDFCKRAEKVLDGVEQTGSSLLRFKQRKAAASGQQSSDMAIESDEAKMRTQLCFDVNFVKQRAKEYGLPTEFIDRLEQLEQRAASLDTSATKLIDSPEDFVE